ncbi:MULTISPECIES: hypothetical protein [unclassified Nostoc]|nr:hypothetical protein [Nostoc sp. ChiQUE02]MDZ8230074.1 hypothetical protein [Nostoc sp. ChiQUE02]
MTQIRFKVCKPLETAAYIEVVLEEGDPKMLSKALKNVIEAKGEIDQFLR